MHEFHFSQVNTKKTLKCCIMWNAQQYKDERWARFINQQSQLSSSHVASQINDQEYYHENQDDTQSKARTTIFWLFSLTLLRVKKYFRLAYRFRGNLKYDGLTPITNQFQIHRARSVTGIGGMNSITIGAYQWSTHQKNIHPEPVYWIWSRNMIWVKSQRK